MSPKRSQEEAATNWNVSVTFNGSNYTAWKIRVKSRRKAKDLWNIVTLRDNRQGLGDDPYQTVYKILHEYKIHNCEVLFREDCTTDDVIDVIEGNRKYVKRESCTGFLLETLTDGLVISVGAKHYAYEVFGHLKHTYNLKKKSRNPFSLLKYKNGDEMAMHLTKLKRLRDQLIRQSKRVDD
ncbi:GTP-binding protein [Phytophthora megakarya]|uniref:GTP-binding protein n=1 Tax=Phytophthora megakarya TaxID=4795 RepID=A0A225WUY4_9STRA|nr:GTP-binding protein [Phytophthora megakarya]